MKFLNEYRDPELGKLLVQRISSRSTKPVRLMEFCGGHTASILKHGIRQLLPLHVDMLSGPGCPVCVTSSSDIDSAIVLARRPGVILVTFGDMIRVPGSISSLQKVRAEGADVRVVYSAQDALAIAQKNPKKSVVFVGIGFETTAPTIAVSVVEAKKLAIKNYYVFSLHKLCPPVIRALLDSGEVKLDGIICPGHVSAIIGSYPFEFIAREYAIGSVISGFEPLDILLSVEMLIEQIEKGEPRVGIAYSRGVRPEGNKIALKLLEEVFEVTDADWRGIGRVPKSGLKLAQAYQDFNAEHAFEVEPVPSQESQGCICGDILRGIKNPLDCKLFGKKCTPENPVGPCMVSSEGSCNAYVLYGATYGR